MKLSAKFMEEVARIQEPEVFLGVARLLGVRLVNEDAAEPKEFVEIFVEAVEAFDKKPRKFKRELLKILEKSNRTKGVESANGNTAQDSKE